MQQRSTMSAMSAYRSTRDLEQPQVAAGNGLYDRRAFLAGGAALAAAITGYALSDTAAAQQLTDAPWSTKPSGRVTGRATCTAR